MEEWRPLVGYEGLYEISSLGRIRGLERKCDALFYGNPGKRYVPPKLLSQTYDKDGYLHIRLSKNGKRETYSVHRLVAKTFLQNPDNKPQVNHINGHKDDNRIENLEWCTASENVLHGYRTGLYKTVHNAKPVAKLSDDGDIISVYESARKAEMEYHKENPNSANILRICAQGYGHCHGYGWKNISSEEYFALKEKLP